MTEQPKEQISAVATTDTKSSVLPAKKSETKTPSDSMSITVPKDTETFVKTMRHNRFKQIVGEILRWCNHECLKDMAGQTQSVQTVVDALTKSAVAHSSFPPAYKPFVGIMPVK